MKPYRHFDTDQWTPVELLLGLVFYLKQFDVISVIPLFLSECWFHSKWIWNQNSVVTQIPKICEDFQSFQYLVYVVLDHHRSQYKYHNQHKIVFQGLSSPDLWPYGQRKSLCFKFLYLFAALRDQSKFKPLYKSYLRKHGACWHWEFLWSIEVLSQLASVKTIFLGR